MGFDLQNPAPGYATVSRLVDDSQLAVAARTSHNRTPASRFTPNVDTSSLAVRQLNYFVNAQIELLDW